LDLKTFNLLKLRCNGLTFRTLGESLESDRSHRTLGENKETIIVFNKRQNSLL